MTGRWLQRLFGLAVFAAGLLPARTGHAEEKARLVYARGPGVPECPAEIELRLWVIARLGYDPFNPQASRVVLARVEKRGGQLVGTVELVDQAGLSSGRRELAAPKGGCGELSRAMALTISLTIDAERATAIRNPSGARFGIVGGGASSDDPPAEPEPMPAPHRSREVRLFAGAALAGAFRILPGFAMGGGGYLGIGWRAYSLQLEARALQSFRAELPVEGSLTGQVVDPGLAGCRSFGPTGLCLVTQLGIERVRSSGLYRKDTVTALHAAAGPRFSWYFPQTPRLSMVFGAEALLNISRNHARMVGREVWKSPLLSGILVIGAETDFF